MFLELKDYILLLKSTISVFNESLYLEYNKSDFILNDYFQKIKRNYFLIINLKIIIVNVFFYLEINIL